MGVTEAVLLGCIQGLTEFLPISSSAHLVVAQSLLGVNAPGISLEVAAHLGTLVAILVVFFRPLGNVLADGLRGAMMYLRREGADAVRARAPLFPVALAVALGSVPVVCAGALFQGSVERVFGSLTACGAFLFVTGLILLASRLAPGPDVTEVGPARGFLIGVAQAFALLPGISRSGATIVTGSLLGVERAAAARFSFILAVPATVGAVLWKLWEGWRSAGGLATGVDCPDALTLGLTAVASAVVGTICLASLLHIVRRGRLYWFAAYCIPAGAAMTAAGFWIQ